MPTWLFALVVLLFGLVLAYYIDWMKTRPGGEGGQAGRRERSKWLYYWFVGRLPTKEEEEEDDRQAKQEELNLKRQQAEAEQRRKNGKKD